MFNKINNYFKIRKIQKLQFQQKVIFGGTCTDFLISKLDENPTFSPTYFFKIQTKNKHLEIEFNNSNINCKISEKLNKENYTYINNFIDAINCLTKQADFYYVSATNNPKTFIIVSIYKNDKIRLFIFNQENDNSKEIIVNVEIPKESFRIKLNY